MQKLNAKQRAAAESFVKAQKNVEQGALKRRLDAAERAFKEGVFGTTLAELSGLGPSRCYQLRDELIEAGRLPAELKGEGK